MRARKTLHQATTGPEAGVQKRQNFKGRSRSIYHFFVNVNRRLRLPINLQAAIAELLD